MTGGGDAESLIKRAIGHLDKVLKGNDPLSKHARNRVVACKDALVKTLYELETYGDLDDDTRARVPHLLYEVAQILENP